MRSLILILTLIVCASAYTFDEDSKTLLIREGPDTVLYEDTCKLVEWWGPVDYKYHTSRTPNVAVMQVPLKYNGGTISRQLEVLLRDSNAWFIFNGDHRRAAHLIMDLGWGLTYLAVSIEDGHVNLHVNDTSISYDLDSANTLPCLNVFTKVEIPEDFDIVRISSDYRSNEEMTEYWKDQTEVVPVKRTCRPVLFPQTFHSLSVFSLSGRTLKGSRKPRIFIKGGDLKLKVQ